MQAFTDFILQVTYPPNPIRNLDNSLTAGPGSRARRSSSPQTPDGSELPSDTFHNCNGCHALDPHGQRPVRRGQARASSAPTAAYSFEHETQIFKVPHLRNLYQKVGMFGMGATFDPTLTNAPFAFLPPPYNDESFTGRPGARLRLPARRQHRHGVPLPRQHRLHPARRRPTRSRTRAASRSPARPTIRRRPSRRCWPTSRCGGRSESFMLAFDSNLAPIVGQQVTLTAGSGADVHARIDLLEARAAAGECDLVVHGRRAVGRRLPVRPGARHLHPGPRPPAAARRSGAARPGARRRADLHGRPARQRPPHRHRSRPRRRARRRRAQGARRPRLRARVRADTGLG